MGGARQGDLFAADGAQLAAGGAADELPLLRHQLLAWQERLGAFQEPLFRAAAQGGENLADGPRQVDLFSAAGLAGGRSDPGAWEPVERAARFNPLELAAQSLQFWRWPEPAQLGAALYLVLDRPPQLPQPLLLYVGETGQAGRRWKGEHDCKGYLAAYGEALQRCGLPCRTSIRFWVDVPAAVKPRRALEQALIRRWQPPFNKETRQRWATPFTADPP